MNDFAALQMQGLGSTLGQMQAVQTPSLGDRLMGAIGQAQDTRSRLSEVHMRLFGNPGLPPSPIAGNAPKSAGPESVDEQANSLAAIGNDIAYITNNIANRL